MDIQSRKINFIQEFLSIQNEELISRVENFLKKEIKKIDESEQLQAMSVEDFNIRINRSMDDSIHDRIIETNDLIEEIKLWQ